MNTKSITLVLFDVDGVPTDGKAILGPKVRYLKYLNPEMESVYHC
jgi:3-deoxy-D-manno-octulosonate 8-phosphate phosphatase KdsC-like HAD superfamily phosphatase